MKGKKDFSETNYYSTFTRNQPARRSTQEEISDNSKSQFHVAKKYRGTMGSPYVICMYNRRNYKYNDK